MIFEASPEESRDEFLTPCHLGDFLILLSFAHSPWALKLLQSSEAFKGGKDHDKKKHLELIARNSLAWTTTVHWRQQLWYHRLTQVAFFKNEPFCTLSLDQETKSQKHQKGLVKLSLTMLGLSELPASNRGVWTVASPSMNNFPELPPLGTVPHEGNALRGVTLKYKNKRIP